MRITFLTLFTVVCLAASSQTTVIKEHVDPLLETAWGQDAPYNLLCPEKTNANGDLQHCRVGCVACAMAQVMRFHRYPEVGIGTGTNMFNSSLKADFGSTHYDWSHMLPSYAAVSYSDEEALAVATLMYHCGVAVNMIYGLTSSATFTAFANNMTSALTSRFGYESEGLRSVNRSAYSKEQWLALIREELSAGRPIIYSGTSPTMGGHTWVVDGYDAEGRVHMNWGWLGTSNGYYDPDLKAVGVDFSEKQSMVIGIRPKQAVTAILSVSASASSADSDADDAWYNMNGQRISRPTARGMYLHNGHKVIINH